MSSDVFVGGTCVRVFRAIFAKSHQHSRCVRVGLGSRDTSPIPLADDLVFFGHYDNRPKYTAIFHGCKNQNFQRKKNDMCLIFAQNIDSWYRRRF